MEDGTTSASAASTPASDAADAMAERVRTDRHRPEFHFVAPVGWLNDPNGLAQWNGLYHRFYQHNPGAAVHADMHWGHASSADLIHWTDEPVALTPSAGPDAGGCWSGVLVDDSGIPTLVYSGHRDGVGERACLATGDAELRHWRKDPANPVLAELPPDLDLLAFRDHCVWRAGHEWLQLVGSGIRGVGGTALLYRSADLRSWEHLGPILVGDAHDHDVWTGSVWECPDLFRLGDPDAPAPDVLLHSVWDDEATHYGVYQTGRFDGRRFHPAQKHHLDHGLHHFYAAQSFADDHGRRVVFGWLQEGRPVPAQVRAGWSGVMSLPRQVTLTTDGQLHQQPVAEVARLRSTHHQLGPTTLEPGQTLRVTEVAGDQLDLELDLDLPPGGAVDLGILATPDGVEQTVVRVAHDPAGAALLALDRSASSLDDTTDTRPLSGPFTLYDGHQVRLRVLVDHSAVEIFANGQPLTARVYPTRSDAVDLHLTAHGTAAALTSFEAWEMVSIWSGPRPLRP